jgi:hypothetical protein
MSLKSLLQNIKNKFSGEKKDEVTREDGSPMPPIKSGKMPLSAIARILRWRKERRGKVRGYKKRNIPYMGSFRALRQHRIRMSQLQGIEVANDLRAAKKEGTRGAMHSFLLKHYPQSNHNARA